MNNFKFFSLELKIIFKFMWDKDYVQIICIYLLLMKNISKYSLLYLIYLIQLKKNFNLWFMDEI